VLSVPHDVESDSAGEPNLRITQRSLSAIVEPLELSPHPLQNRDPRGRFLSTRQVFVFVLATGLLVLAVRDLSDPDIWWHLRTGQLILETKVVPHTDPFSCTRMGQPWVTHEWLTEVMLYVVYTLGGKGALVCGFALIIASAFLITYHHCQGRPYIAGIVTLWGALASIPAWGARPQMLSLLLTSLFLVLLDHSDQKPRLLWWLPPIMLIWVNLHGGYAVGIALTALYLMGAAIDHALGRISAEQAVPRLWHLGAATIACLMVVPVNPSGARLYLYPIQALRFRVLENLSEWRPPDFHLTPFQLFFCMALGSVAALSLSKRKIRPHQLLLVIGTISAASHSVRHIPIFVMIAIPLLSQNLEDLLASRSCSQCLTGQTVNSPRLRALNGITLLIVLTLAALRVHQTVRRLDETEAANFPAAASSFLATRQVPAPLLNHYDWGGYLIWRLYPNYHVWVDGRNDLYGDAFMDEYLRLYWALDGWKQQLEGSAVRSAILPPNSPLARSLLQMHDWKRIYEDRQAVILTRIDHSN